MGERSRTRPGVRSWIVGITLVLTLSAPASAQLGHDDARDVVIGWNRLILELVRHTPTYSPPVASRAFAYLGVTAFEAAASGDPSVRSLAGQLNELGPLPQREAGADYDEAILMHAALGLGANEFFGNTGPTGQRAMDFMVSRTASDLASGVPPDIVARSEAFGAAVGAHIAEWARTDGGAVVENLGFPYDFETVEDPALWVPTNRIAVQQAPLLPGWGRNRTFAMPDGATCSIPPPPEYSEAPGSAFYTEAMEVRDAVVNRTSEQEAIARFWSDDPMLSPTPPGHWISIALDALEGDEADLYETVDVLARLGTVLADSFIGCWDAKYRYNLVRPVTYINRLVDPGWQPILITPPFPEYPSGHSTQSGAAAGVLEHHFGDNYTFADATHEADGLAVRHYESFWEAAEEAAISRLYGGIHFRSAIEEGLAQGLCIAKYTNALVTWVAP
ncbi:PAP2 superfamily protein [Pelagibacterium luteolum]|uniref:PAP2 superfamily protein n=1 Tax=Pelagibacterium luteolum TaxID=440168 RepID=A0A1G7VBB3_9HYPH|nr:PAP2 superfamily protein [Pelagibacterium luteolum]